MARASTREEFIEKAKKIHGSKYDYSSVVYKGNKIHVEIICPEHGPFWQRPDSHVVRGQGCPFCGLEKQKSLFHGVGINDVLCERNSPAYTHWAGILKRCYPTDSDKKPEGSKAMKDVKFVKNGRPLAISSTGLNIITSKAIKLIKIFCSKEIKFTALSPVFLFRQE